MCCLDCLTSNLNMYYHNFTVEFICSRYHDILHVIVMVHIYVPYFTSALHTISFATHICTIFCIEHMCTISQNWEFKIVTSTELQFTWTHMAMSNQYSVTNNYQLRLHTKVCISWGALGGGDTSRQSCRKAHLYSTYFYVP